MWPLMTVHLEFFTGLLIDLTSILSGPSSIEWSNIDIALLKTLCVFLSSTGNLSSLPQFVKFFYNLAPAYLSSLIPIVPFFEFHGLKLPNILCFWAFLLFLRNFSSLPHFFTSLICALSLRIGFSSFPKLFQMTLWCAFMVEFKHKTESTILKEWCFYLTFTYLWETWKCFR